MGNSGGLYGKQETSLCGLEVSPWMGSLRALWMGQVLGDLKFKESCSRGGASLGFHVGFSSTEVLALPQSVDRGAPRRLFLGQTPELGGGGGEQGSMAALV